MIFSIQSGLAVCHDLVEIDAFLFYCGGHFDFRSVYGDCCFDLIIVKRQLVGFIVNITFIVFWFFNSEVFHIKIGSSALSLTI